MPKNLALTLLLLSGGLMLIERATNLVSQMAGKLYCGAEYMQPVDGYIGTMSCGFNIDVYVTIALFTNMFIGMFGFIFGAMRAQPEDDQE